MVILACVLGALAIVAGAFARAAGSPTNVFTDPTGDTVGLSPDITGIDYSTTGAGFVTFHVAAALADGSDTFVVLYIDQDDNLATGSYAPDSAGADVFVEYDHLANQYDTERWDATARKWSEVTLGSDFSISSDEDGVTIGIDRKDLGDATHAKVSVFTGAWDASVGAIRQESDGSLDVDWAPDDGGYDVDLSPLTLHADQQTHTAAKAGKRFSVSLAALRSDSGQYVSTVAGQVACTLTVGGKHVYPASPPGVLPGSVPAARCTWQLGKKTKGKALTAVITVSVDGASLSERYSTKVH
ncbi:MAG TPA: hypothetical protein VHD91_13095 [Gaiellaceae bacterium]|nr:hypothetical protein [Gaiellaceae bacterium]